VDTALESDIKACILLREMGDTSQFNLTPPKVDSLFFLDNVFSLSAVNTKTFILLLASQQPKSFLSGANVDLDKVLLTCNRTEFHHIFPKDHLAKGLKIDSRDVQFRLANFAFLSQTDNRKIKNRPPDQYEKDIPAAMHDEIFARAVIPLGSLSLPYEDFCRLRADELVGVALALAKA
jgi:hypothetical protein